VAFELHIAISLYCPLSLSIPLVIDK
jgi:hypothetical protein